MSKKIKEFIYVTTCMVGSEDSYRVVCDSATEAWDAAHNEAGPYSFAVYEKVRDVNITRTVSVTEEKV